MKRERERERKRKRRRRRGKVWISMNLYGLLWICMDISYLSHPQPLPKRMKGAQNYTGTLYFLFKTLVGPSLITESKYHIQIYKIKIPL